MLATLVRRSGGHRWPYAKEVYFTTGGHWTQPKSWLSNTVIVTAGISAVTFGLFLYSSEHEWRHVAPVKWIPSMMWAKQFRTGELGVLDLTTGPPKDYAVPDLPSSQSKSDE